MGKEFKRTDRIAEQLRRELAKLIQHEVKDPRVGMVTVSAVSVASDLSHAKVYVSHLGTSAEINETIAVLNKASSFLRTLLAKRVQLRATPQLRFVEDKSIAEGGRLSTLIDDAMSQSDSLKKKSEE